ncbi:peptide deformylase [Iodobacter sp. BJB302]|nr:peptide deformylase [Iodobacter sp. BJB302]
MLAECLHQFFGTCLFDYCLFYSHKQEICLWQSPLLLAQTKMAILNILHYPDDRLYTIAKPVTVFDDRLQQLVRDMSETMYAAPGIGLAATQVNVHQRVVVIDISEEKNSLMALINPQIVTMDGKTMWEEGCLSVPGIYEEVERAERVKVRALDIKGEIFELEADGLLAICIQHELDHLDGKVFVEKLSKLKLSRIVQKLKKNQRKTM